MSTVFCGAPRKQQGNSSRLCFFLPPSSTFFLLLPHAFFPFCNSREGCNAGSMQLLHGWAGVFTPIEQFTFKQFLKASFKWPWAFWLEIQNTFWKKNEYINFIAKLNYVFKYSGLSFRVTFVAVCNLHISVFTFRLED